MFTSDVSDSHASSSVLDRDNFTSFDPRFTSLEWEGERPPPPLCCCPVSRGDWNFASPSGAAVPSPERETVDKRSTLGAAVLSSERETVDKRSTCGAAVPSPVFCTGDGG